jgi:NitT/TauT family transport system substrate-binding protein
MLPVRITLRLATLVACLAFSLFAAGGKAEAATTEIAVGTVAPGPTYWPLYIGEDLGLFEKAGLRLDVYSSGGTTAQQLVVGAVNIACSGFPDFMRATYGGATVKIFMNSIDTPPYIVYARPSIKAAADLKGKTISIGGVQDVTLVYIDSVLKAAGLSQKDVDFVYAKAAGDRFRALAAGAVDAAIVNPPASFRAAAMGFSNVGDPSQTMKDFPFTVWAIDTGWAAKHDEATKSFVLAYLQATAWLYDPSHEQSAIQILDKYANVGPKDAKSSYDYMVTQLHAFSSSGSITQTGFSHMTDALLQLRDIKRPVPPISAFYDPSFLPAKTAN